jgi:predicted RNA-binding protein YlqC (UPF0109 family)
MAEVPGGAEQGRPELVTATLAYLARALVERPDDVAVDVAPGEAGSTRFLLRVHPDDVGRVIGRQGRTARAIRRLARAAAARAGVNAHVEIAG